MYSKPDFVALSVKVKDVFCAYPSGVSGCNYDETNVETYTTPCTPDDPDYKLVVQTFIEIQWGRGCYSSYNP